MATFSIKSKALLASCDPRLIRLFEAVVQHFDCTILEGYRTPERQTQLYAEGKTKLRTGGKHNSVPSQAVDVAPFPVDWQDTQEFVFFGGYVLGVADQLGIRVRWGGDWNQNKDLKDQSFNDRLHFELAEE